MIIIRITGTADRCLDGDNKLPNVIAQPASVMAISETLSLKHCCLSTEPFVLPVAL